MKAVLISANRERYPYPVFPIGLSFIAAALTNCGHDLLSFDLCFEPEPCRSLDTFLTDNRPDITIISIRNVDNVTWPGSRSYLEGIRDVVALCRRYGRVIVGGSGFSIMPREALSYLGADYGIVGEGEVVLPELLKRLERGDDCAGLPGVLKAGEVAFLPPRPVAGIITPDRNLFDVTRYQKEGGMANVQTKRGCPFTCVYCTYPLLEGSRMRLRPVEEIIAELRQLQSIHTVDYVYFVDDIFNFPMEFALELCRAMVAEQLTLNWSAFINPAFLSGELVDAMVSAGCDGFEFGTESGSPQMLRNLGKSFDTAQIRHASLLCRERGVDFAHYILFGGPGETEQTILQSFELMDEVTPTAVIAMTGIRIFPGTGLYQTALREGIITPDTDMLQPVFYISPAVRDSLAELVSTEAMKRRNWIAPGLEVNVNDAMLDALRMFPVKGPLWKLMKRLGRSRIRPIRTGEG